MNNKLPKNKLHAGMDWRIVEYYAAESWYYKDLLNHVESSRVLTGKNTDNPQERPEAAWLSDGSVKHHFWLLRSSKYI